MSVVPEPPRRQRVAAYAVIVRDGQVLLSRLAPYLSADERWTLPGGGIDFGEHPDDAVVREVHEETGLAARIGRPLLIDSQRKHAGQSETDLHSVRLVYDAWVAPDAPEPRVVEVDGSTVDARWHRVADVLSGAVTTVPMVRLALDRHRTVRRQRVAAYALVVRDDRVLLTRNATPPHRGRWNLPGGGVDHGEAPAQAVVREVAEETGLTAEVGELLGVHDEQFTGTAPNGLEEDFHGVGLVFTAEVDHGDPAVADAGGTTDAARWVPLAALEGLEVSPVVTASLEMRDRR